MYQQREIYWIDLEPTQGAETRKKRPCVILQCDLVNKGSKTVLIAPILPDHKNWPFAVNIIPSKKNGLDKNRHINVKQLRAIDVSRIHNKQGMIEKQYLSGIKKAIKIVFGMT
ncbi:MAG: type II toxin-antitoxin system PemK/MazF family toxin [Candidatus Omnitrophota bacterium]|jgi:mRNA interferase MazF|nr:MAG: type II toxin-antitoxin system PemK/MazF family toxin [Candidatus Omnitrophota bacterium]